MARVLAITLNPALDLSIALDSLAAGQVQRTRTTQTTPAGKGNNVARVLASLGHDVTVSGFLGVDNAVAFECAFANWGVQDDFIRVAGETRTNVKLSEADGRVTDINAAGAPITPDDWQQLNNRLDALLAVGTDAVVIAGSLPPGVAPEQLGQLVTWLRRQDVAVWLDTSGDALAAAVTAVPTAIKPNDQELAGLLGHDINDRGACQLGAAGLLARGVTHVFVSRGADGVLWCTHNDPGVTCLSARPPAVDVVSTVCAGDTLLAGLLHGQLAGWEPQRTLRFATALSADAVQRIGVGRADGPGFAALCEQVTLETRHLDLPKTPDAHAHH